MQTGHVAKSLKYSEKALEKISSLKGMIIRIKISSKSYKNCVDGFGRIFLSHKCSLFLIFVLFHLEKQPTHLLSVFELLLLENVIVSHVIEGQSNHAIKQVDIRTI